MPSNPKAHPFPGVRGFLLWNGPVRFMFWRWCASERERVRLKQRVRVLEDHIARFER